MSIGRRRAMSGSVLDNTVSTGPADATGDR
jgi:hypothetical protein